MAIGYVHMHEKEENRVVGGGRDRVLKRYRVRCQIDRLVCIELEEAKRRTRGGRKVHRAADKAVFPRIRPAT
jgi:hypothetical protein